MRRGSGQNSTAFEGLPEDESQNRITSTSSGGSSLKASAEHQRPRTTILMPLKMAGFNATSNLEQQSRWMTPLSPQETVPDQESNMAVSRSDLRNTVYNTMPPALANCSTVTSQNVGFLPVGAYSNDSSSSVQVPHQHIPTNHSYSVKAEQSFV